MMFRVNVLQRHLHLQRCQLPLQLHNLSSPQNLTKIVLNLRKRLQAYDTKPRGPKNTGNHISKYLRKTKNGREEEEKGRKDGSHLEGYQPKEDTYTRILCKVNK